MRLNERIGSVAFAALLFVGSLLGLAEQARCQALSAEEASGITRQGGHLLVVSDNVPGTYFRVRVPESSPAVIRLTSDRLEAVKFAKGDLAVDLEGIAVLADGRVAAVSERLRSLVGEGGIIAEYDNPVSELGNSGLEGVAARDIGNGLSEVAVLWEGGYPETKDLPAALRDIVGGRAMEPVVWIHRLAPGAMGVRIKENDVRVVRLKVPRPEGNEPGAQRFRAPDLVWHTWKQGDQEELGFIVLLASRNVPTEGKAKYEHTWLQRFRLSGEAYGVPLDVKRAVPSPLADANWEGLGWFESGKRVVVVHDKPPAGDPTAVIIDLPADW